MALRETLASARHRLRYSGVRGLLWWAAERCLAPIGEAGLESICRKDLSAPLTDVTARVEIDISQVTDDDIDQIVELARSNWGDLDEGGPYAELGYRGTIEDRLRRGEKCFVARSGTEVVHYNWIALDQAEAIAGTGLVAELVEGEEAVCHDGLTAPAFRGMGIHTAVNNSMLKWLKESGYRTAYTVVGTVSRSSNITHHRLNWEFTGVMLYLISRRTGKPRVWRLKGSLEPFRKP
jgi:hypothetical protein